MKLHSLLKDLPNSGALPEENPEITGLCWDSRKAKPGDLFFALPGRDLDGAGFVEAAAAQGAVAYVAERRVDSVSIPGIVAPDAREFMAHAAARFHGQPSHELKVVGVTGTNGKTTTTWLVKHVLDEVSRPCGLIGTIHYSLGRDELPASHTTPESPEIQGLLAGMVAVKSKACAMEVSSHALVQHRADAIRFAAAVFTNLTQDHLDFHKDMDSYFNAKARLFELMKASNKNGRAVVNLDDRFGHRLLSKVLRDAPTITYGLGVGADFRATNIRFEASGTSYALQARGKEYLVRLPLIGLFNVYNSLAALGACSALGVDVRSAVAALARAPQVPGRLQRVPAKRSFQVFVDYAHTPDALENVLKTIRELIPNRLITVFGCGGDRDRTKRAPMGRAAETLSDHVILTSDNPRNEDPARILDDIREGMRGRGYEVIVDRAEAIRRAVELAEPGDIVLIAGKGHESYQEILGVRTDFDDVTVAKWAIEDKKVVLE